MACPPCSLGLSQIPKGRPLLLVGNHQTLALDLGENVLAHTGMGVGGTVGWGWDVGSWGPFESILGDTGR